MSRRLGRIRFSPLRGRTRLRLAALLALSCAVSFGGAVDQSLAQTCATGLTAPPLPVGEWTMVGLSCDPGAAATVATVWGDDIAGTYGTDWIVYERLEGTDTYLPLDLTSTLGDDAGVDLGGSFLWPGSQGVGYWIKSNNGGTWDVQGTATNAPLCFGLGMPGCFGSLMHAPSGAQTELFNLLGSPFPDDIPWGETSIFDGAAIVPLSTAVLNGEIDGTAWKNWSGAAYASFNAGTPGMTGCLEAFGGFWVRVLSTVGTGNDPVLLIPDAPATPGSCDPPPPVFPNGSIATSRSQLRQERAALKRGEWFIRLIAEAPAEGLRDAANVLGQLSGSVTGLDTNDLAALAPFDGNYLDLIFRHEDWDNWTTDFNSDYRAPSRKEEIWSFVVTSGDPNRDVVLSWEGTRRMGNSWLMDVKTGEVIKARRRGGLQTYSFNMEGELEREFTWAVVPR